MKIIFMGTPEFAVPALEKIIDNYSVEAVFTQPDRPKGRGKKIAMSAVKETALKYNIPVFQPERLKKNAEMTKVIKDINPDFIIVIAYGQILPKEILDIPRLGCINLHASLLPRYRGAGPINWAIINGEQFTGNTTMFMNEGLDTGDILLQNRIEITTNMNAGELHDLLMNNGAELILKTIDGIEKGTIIPKKQQNELSCYAPMLDKKIAKIDWSENCSDIKNLIRGLNPWPVAYTQYNGKAMKIFEAEAKCCDVKQNPGIILNVSKKGIEVSAGDGIIIIKRLQFPGGKPLSAEEYIRGNKIEQGINLNS